MTISPLQSWQIDEAVDLFRVQLEEHGITTLPRRIRSVIKRVVADERRGFILVATIPDGTLLGVARVLT